MFFKNTKSDYFTGIGFFQESQNLFESNRTEWKNTKKKISHTPYNPPRPTICLSAETLLLNYGNLQRDIGCFVLILSPFVIPNALIGYSGRKQSVYV